MGGSHELAIILNQLIYLDKWLSVSQVKRYCLSDKHHVTIRRQLNHLVKLGLVQKRTDNLLYDAHLYRATPDLYKDTLTLVALVDGKDMLFANCYTEAEIVNKFRQLAADDRASIQLSATGIKNLISSEKSQESIRLKLKALEEKGYIKSCLTGRIKEYYLNKSLLLNTRTPEVIAEQSNELLTIFTEHSIFYHKKRPSQSSLRSWKQTFNQMLYDGYDFDSLMQIIAYLAIDAHWLNIVKSPAKLRTHYDDLYILAYTHLSRRKARRYIYKLLNDLLAAPKPPKPIIPYEEVWYKVEEWLQSIKGMLPAWYKTSLAGVTDIDFEDYLTQARLFAYNFIMDPPASESSRRYPNNWLKLRLQDYMLSHRHKGDNGKIINFINNDDFEYDNLVDTKSVAGDLSEESDLFMTLIGGILEKDINEIIKTFPSVHQEIYNKRYEESLLTEELATRFNMDMEDILNFLQNIHKSIHERLSQKYPLLNDLNKTKAVLAGVLEQLPEREKDIIIDKYGLDGHKYTFEELSSKYNLALSWTHTLVKRIENHLREALEPPG